MPDEPPTPEPPVVAIVDDDDAIRTALARLVRTLGYRTRTFESGEALLREIDALRPACALTDIQMPGMNGLALIKELRRRGHNIPVVAMTAYPGLTHRDLALAAGALEFMTKPIDDNRLENWLSTEIGEPQKH